MKGFFRKLQQVYRPLEIPASEPNPLPIVGAVLVFFSLTQYAYILFPLQPGNIDWEFQVIGQLVDNALTPVLGIALFMYGRTVELPLWRLHGMRILTWLSLILAILYVAIIPLAVADTFRLNTRLNSQMSAAHNQAESQQGKVRNALDNATSMEELQILITVLNLTPSMAQRDREVPDDSFIERRDWLWETIRANQNRMIEEATELYHANKTALFKTAAKIGVGAGFMCLLYLYFFFAFRNVRRQHRLKDGA